MPSRQRPEALLMIASSEADANLYYRTRFRAPDPFVFMEIRGKSYALLSDLEIDRARSTSDIDYPVSVSDYVRKFEAQYGRKPARLDLVVHFAKKKGVRAFSVPGNFPLEYADLLRKKGFRITVKPEPVFRDRPVKTRREIAAITANLRAVEHAAHLAVSLLKKSVIRRGKLFYGGALLTSESLRRMIALDLMTRDCFGRHMIVSCGRETADPHHEGHGPLYAHQPIIMDIFPQSTGNLYFADFTRTVVRGKASPKLKKMYAAVKEGQNIAFRSIRDGADGSKIYQAVKTHLADRGFPTGVLDGRRQGFFHGLGHGLGLEIHEAPGLSIRPETLKKGNVVTVEPGLYYADAGGVRLEDVVVVTKTGCINLTRFEKRLEL
ncbi:MAG: M24 family metallopeptidase [Candidatus Omnitrophota bacterium]|jgi:Xaa-Pro aminopeptidase